MIQKMLAFLTILAVAIVESKQTYAYQKCTQLSFLPMPKKIECNIKDQVKYSVNPCSISYSLKSLNKSEDFSHVQELIEDQQYKTFKCRSANFQTEDTVRMKVREFLVEIELMDSSLESAFNKKEEAYSLKITKGKALIQARHYVGFVRALETFLQSITCNRHSKDCFMLALPIQIQDQPLFQYRGVLVDSSRHFLPVRILKETIDALMYNKMNILHWHIVDQDSFPLELQSHPELAEHAAFSIYERYSTKQVKEVVHYAMIRGVRVIPEIDTPGHAASWGKAPQNADVACVFENHKYKGPLDVTLDKTYQLVKQVFKEVFELFPDPLVHLGGDQVTLSCLKNKTEFMKLENVKQDLIEYQYRKKQKKLLKQLNPNKRFIYWANQQSIFPQQDDIIHWWGDKTLIPSGKESQIIISQYKSPGVYYIDMGAGNILGNQYYDYATWQDMHIFNIGKEIESFKNKDKVIGSVVTLWTEMSNYYTHHAKIWIRSSSIAQRTWTLEEHLTKPDFFRRITAHERLMHRRGIPTAPATCQQCELNPQFC